jgi:hypothetical protein
MPLWQALGLLLPFWQTHLSFAPTLFTKARTAVGGDYVSSARQGALAATTSKQMRELIRLPAHPAESLLTSSGIQFAESLGLCRLLHPLSIMGHCLKLLVKQVFNANPDRNTRL